ncbi:hypothetical protein FGB62_91g013 [Gracilaria domingensis]|nr:hypothetical protein FGB62_91g013 [Gracilaria domingensis]
MVLHDRQPTSGADCPKRCVSNTRNSHVTISYHSRNPGVTPSLSRTASVFSRNRTYGSTPAVQQPSNSPSEPIRDPSAITQSSSSFREHSAPSPISHTSSAHQRRYLPPLQFATMSAPPPVENSTSIPKQNPPEPTHMRSGKKSVSWGGLHVLTDAPPLFGPYNRFSRPRRGILRCASVSHMKSTGLPPVKETEKQSSATSSGSVFRPLLRSVPPPPNYRADDVRSRRDDSVEQDKNPLRQAVLQHGNQEKAESGDKSQGNTTPHNPFIPFARFRTKTLEESAKDLKVPKSLHASRRTSSPAPNQTRIPPRRVITKTRAATNNKRFIRNLEMHTAASSPKRRGDWYEYEGEKENRLENKTKLRHDGFTKNKERQGKTTKSAKQKKLVRKKGFSFRFEILKPAFQKFLRDVRNDRWDSRSKYSSWLVTHIMGTEGSNLASAKHYMPRKRYDVGLFTDYVEACFEARDALQRIYVHSYAEIRDVDIYRRSADRREISSRNEHSNFSLVTIQLCDHSKGNWIVETESGMPSSRSQFPIEHERMLFGPFQSRKFALKEWLKRVRLLCGRSWEEIENNAYLEVLYDAPCHWGILWTPPKETHSRVVARLLPAVTRTVTPYKRWKSISNEFDIDFWTTRS